MKECHTSSYEGVQHEDKMIAAILAGHDYIAGRDYRVIPRAGVEIINGEEPEKWLDFDDVMLKTTESKKERLERFQSYLMERFGTYIKDDEFLMEMGKDMVDFVDKEFSRWAFDWRDKTYHGNAHALGVQYMVNRLVDVVRQDADDNQGQEEEYDQDRTTEESISRQEAFSRSIKESKGNIREMYAQLTGGKLIEPEGLTEDERLAFRNKYPFYFTDDGRVAMRGLSHIWDPELHKIFRETVSHMDFYDDIIEMASESDGPVGIFTFGPAYSQLEKVSHVLESLAERGIRLDVSRILLTEIPKGEFIKKRTALSTNGEGKPAKFVMFDDDPKVHVSLAGAFEEMGIRERYVPVRVIRDNIKTTNKGGDPEGTAVLDFRRKEPATSRISLRVLLELGQLA